MHNSFNAPKMHVLIVALTCVYFAVRPASPAVSRPSTMVLQNNEFSNVVVAIHESIPENAALIDTLKNTLEEASKYLYKATRQRAYFKEIKILLPSTWTPHAAYDHVTSETLNMADIVITDPIRGKRSLPQTRSYEGCGRQGVHVLITKDFLTNPTIDPYTNNSAKYLVHAFAQFRWGVFQEYAEEGEEVFYVSFNSGIPEAIKCIYFIRGLIERNDTSSTTPCYITNSLDPLTGLYDKHCVWNPYPTRQRAEASIMDHQYITALETFCDDNRTNYMTVHNYEAPSKHNRLCGHRSTWDIVTSTPDFAGGNNPPRFLLDQQLTPTFKIMRASARRKRALVFVESESPKVTEESLLAIGRLKRETSRNDIQLVHVQGKVLSETDFVTDEHVILVTQNMTSATHALKKQNVHVVIPRGFEDKRVISEIHSKFHHQGRVHVEGQVYVHQMLDHMRTSIFSDLHERYTIITQREIILNGLEPIEGEVGVDETLARHMTFIFLYEDEVPSIDLSSPSGAIFDMNTDTYHVDIDFKMIQFHFHFTEVGLWKFKIHQTAKDSQKVRLTVISSSSHERHDSINVKTSVKITSQGPNIVSMHVDVTQGVHPVVGLNVSAYVETPGHKTLTLQLFDNGAGADITKHDGVYSREYSRFTDVGLHHVTFVIHGYGMRDVHTKEETFSIDMTKRRLNKHVTKRSVNGGVERHVYGGVVYLPDKAIKDEQNLLTMSVPPSRVHDLRATLSLKYRRTVVLTWASAADDVNHGHDISYTIYVGYDINDVRAFLDFTDTGLYNGTGNVEMERFDRSTSGYGQEVKLWMPKRVSKTLAFAIKAVDSSGKVGPSSNVASALNPRQLMSRENKQ
ncbi:calcium-activated chloride channel regulator 1-like isoform X2 [Dreissena polymorpha]|uniref:calcium-activated chloride channel regulator 1-like isoform X2 n=1 Tax=Dreissena polymorpha TaxID=45954 RepID=UPI002264E82F|nr:calcium-activated chloride channel regulator 1-like isoform X2 [Dreissena polymorpha]